MPSPSPTSTSGEQRASNGTPIRITFGDTELDGDMGPIERLPEGASVTIERAG